MVIRLFEEFIEEGIVKRITPDKQRAANLYLESERKFSLLQKTINSMGVDNENANDFVEYCYNTIMFLIRAKMLEQGYISSGQGAHEAEVAFAQILDFTKPEIELLDKLRYFRNGILYYGKRFDKDYAAQVIEFTKKIFVRLKK